MILVLLLQFSILDFAEKSLPVFLGVYDGCVLRTRRVEVTTPLRSATCSHCKAAQKPGNQENNPSPTKN